MEKMEMRCYISYIIYLPMVQQLSLIPKKNPLAVYCYVKPDQCLHFIHISVISGETLLLIFQD